MTHIAQKQLSWTIDVKSSYPSHAIYLYQFQFMNISILVIKKWIRCLNQENLHCDFRWHQLTIGIVALHLLVWDWAFGGANCYNISTTKSTKLIYYKCIVKFQWNISDNWGLLQQLCCLWVDDDVLWRLCLQWCTINICRLCIGSECWL